MKKLYQIKMTDNIRTFLLTCFVLSLGYAGFAQQTTTALPNNASYSNKTGPQGGLRYQRGFYLIKPSEMSSSGMSSGMNINAIGFKIGRASSDTAHGAFKVYLQNTPDTVSRADTGWNHVTVSTNHYYLTPIVPGNYEWQVRANCSSSSGFTPSVVFSNADLSGCNNPYNLNTVGINTTGATLTWEAAASAGFANFKVEYSRADSVSWSTANTTDTFYLVSGLLPGKSYQWRVTTMCGSDSSSVNSSSFATATVSNCNSPSGLSAIVSSDSLVALSWTGAAGALYYEIQFRRVGTGSWSTTSSFSTTADLILPIGTTYEWRMRTVCGPDSTGTYVNGSNFSTGGTAICYVPTNPYTSQIKYDSAKLVWTAVVGATNYTVRYRLKNTISWTNAITPMTMVCDSNIIVPDTIGVFDIPFHGGGVFNYTGNGVYVAWEFSRPAGALISASMILSTTAGTSLKGSNGQDSVQYLLCMITNADTSLTSMPSILSESKERPETRFGSGDLKDSVSVVAVYALGMTVPKFQSPTPVSALVANHSGTNQNYDVTLTVKEKLSGAVRYTNTQNVPVSANDTVVVSYNGWSPSLMETDSLIVSIPAEPNENVVNNNRKAYVQLVNPSFIAFDDGTAVVSSAGFGLDSGLIISKHSMLGCGQVLSASVYLTESAEGQTLHAVVVNVEGTIVATSNSFVPGEDDVNRYHSFYFTSPPSFEDESFYIGISQPASLTANYPVGTQWEDAKTRDGAYFRANLDGSMIRDSAADGRLMIRAEVSASGAVAFISGNLLLCTGGSTTLTAGSDSTRYTNSVINYSSQNGNIDYSAGQTLGTPNVYPMYALSPNAWVSSSADGQREYLVLGFPGAAPVNFVDIYEVASPGAVDSVFVKNPATMNFELVYSATAAAAPAAARKNRISFPMTAFNVSEIRIALNSPAVAGYNSIDAVGIGKTAVPGTFTTYSWSPGGATTNSIVVNTPGVYRLTTTNADGCTSKDSVTVIAASTTPPTITASGPSAICQGDSIILTSSQPTGNTWSTGATTASITVHTAGSYTVSYNDGSGCGALVSAPFAVTVNPLPTATISGSTQICLGGSTVLNAGAGFTSYQWSTGESTQTITVSTAGIYIVFVTNSNGCRDSASVTTTYQTLAAPVITGSLSFCPGGSTTLDAGAGYSSYSWSTGATSQTIVVNSSGTYGVEVTNAGGCEASSSVIVSTFTPPSPVIGGAPGFCTGGSTTLDAGAGYASYLWSTSATTQTIVVSTTGNVSVTVTDINGCSGTDDLTIAVFPNPVPLISGTLSFCGGTSTTLNAGTGYTSYLWSTGATTQTIIVNTVGTFSVAVTNANGCVDSTSVTTTNTGSLPASPGPISGPILASCNTTGHVYSISAVPNTSHYVWTLPAGATIASGDGTTSITVNYGPTFQGGYIVVAASNACGQSPSLVPTRLFVQSLVNAPGSISGATSAICGPTTRSYSIAAVPTALSYTWTAPANASVTSGQGTTSVTISFGSGFTFGNVCVTANNACGSSTPSCMQVTGAAPTPGAISGMTAVCKNAQNLIYSISSVPGATSYTWTVPQSASIVVGQGTTTIVVNMGTRSGNITVRANSACGTSAASTLPILVFNCGRGLEIYTLDEIRPVPEVISNYGGAGKAGKINLEWTLGEPRIEAIRKSDMLFTQGFHQPLITRKPINAPLKFDIRVAAYPNPVTSVLNVRIESLIANRPLMLEITDVSGLVMHHRRITVSSDDNFEIRMDNYLAGSYFLLVRDMNGRIIHSSKLEKMYR